MKASVSPALAAMAVFFSFACAALNGEDILIQKDGQQRVGEILGVRNNSISMKIGPATTGIPLANVASVSKEEPAAFKAALASWAKNNAPATIQTLKPLVETFIGLPTPWAERAAGLLGEAYLEVNDPAAAEASFSAFQKAYPTASESAALGLARLAISKKDFATAKEKIAPLVAAALKTKFPESGKSSLYGQSLYLLGQIQEAASDHSAALQNYLLVSTVFFEDSSVAARAAERADALKQKNVIVP